MDWLKRNAYLLSIIVLIILGFIFISFSLLLKKVVYLNYILSIAGQTFWSVALLLLLFQIPLVKNDFIEIILASLNTEKILNALKEEKVKELLINLLKVYVKDENASFIREYLNQLPQFLDYYFLKIDLSFYFTLEETYVKKRIYGIYCIKLNKNLPIHDLLPLKVVLHHKNDSAELSYLEISIDNKEYKFSKEEIKDILKKEENNGKWNISLDKNKFISLCKKKGIPTELERHNEIIVKKEEVRKTYKDFETVLQTRHFVKEFNITALVEDRSLKPKLVSFNAHDKKHIVTDTQGYQVELKGARWIHPGGGFIIYLIRGVG